MFRLAQAGLCFLIIFSFLFCGCKAKPRERVSAAQQTESNRQSTIRKEESATRAENKQEVDSKALACIEEVLPKDNGEWAVYYKNLKTGAYCSINNHKMVSASLIKLFIMAMVYEEIHKGNLEDTGEIEGLMEKMITISHNDSSNELVAIAAGRDFQEGMKKVNEYALSIHCTDTEQQRNMLDDRPVPILEQNYTSVEDCATLLEKIYRKECVSPALDEKMLSYLMQQQRTWKIPAGLPDDVKVANKTGEMSTTENDIAIIFTEKADYLLCVISNDIENTQAAQESIRQISSEIYEYVTQS